MSKRVETLETAAGIITQDRAATHGEAEDTFGRIAAMWTAYLDGYYEFTEVDVAAMMALLKIARLAHNQNHLDNYVDGCGYLALASEMARAE